MKLVYKATGKEVKIGDVVTTSKGEKCIVTYFRPPHKPSSSGKVTVKFEGDTFGMEYYVSVIGAEWVEREDRM
jgi:hypothetical protein